MHIEKLYYTLPEIIQRWSISEEDLIYLAENDQLRLSVRVFGVPVEFGSYEETPDGQVHRVPSERRPLSGLLDLHAHDVFQLFRCGELHLTGFRLSGADYAVVTDEAKAVFVLIGDLLLKREERDRFEVQSGFAAGGHAVDAGTFVASHDYQEVLCNGHKFRLGPIQAQVVRVLHEAAEVGEPWQNGKKILTAAGSRCLKMSDVFKSKNNWRELIRSDRRGGYRLNVD